MRRRLIPEQASRILTQRLIASGLPSYSYTAADGRNCVHTAPKEAAAAGTHITVTPAIGTCVFFSEWGNRIGDARCYDEIVNHILWLYGRTSRARR